MIAFVNKSDGKIPVALLHNITRFRLRFTKGATLAPGAGKYAREFWRVFSKILNFQANHL